VAGDLKQKLRHVYWIGGSPCLGKSLIVDLLAKNGMLRDVGFEEYVAETAVSLNYPVIHVDGSRTIDANAAQFRWVNQGRGSCGNGDG
jgi:hypothetical protein